MSTMQRDFRYFQCSVWAFNLLVETTWCILAPRVVVP